MAALTFLFFKSSTPMGTQGMPGYPGLQGIQGLPGMGVVSPQMSGSGFDSRFSPAASSPDGPISGLPAHHGPFQGQAAQPPSRNGSPAASGSPRPTSAGPTTPRD